MTHFGVSGIPGADSQGNQTGSAFSSGDLAVSLSGSGKVTPELRVGLTVKALQSTIGSYRSNLAFASDFGVSYNVTQLWKPFSVGLSVTNLGQGTRFISQTDPLPTAVNLGVAVPWGPAALVAEANRYVYDQRNEFGLGLEWGLGPVSFRGGYLAAGAGSNPAAVDQGGTAGLFQGLSFGLGVKAGSMRVDYALSQQAPQLGPAQRLALTLQWGQAGMLDDEKGPARGGGAGLDRRCRLAGAGAAGQARPSEVRRAGRSGGDVDFRRSRSCRGWR